MALRKFIIGILLIMPSISLAEFNSNRDTALGVGIATVRFNTNVKFNNKLKNRSFFIDAEGSLDLPAWDTVPVLYGLYRFSQKHSIGFSYFQVKRESTVFKIDDTFDDVTVSGQIQFTDDTRFYNVFYSNTLYEDNRSRVMGKVGLNALDISYNLNARGTITFEDDSKSEEYTDGVSVLAPMPLLGLDFWYAFTPKWGIDTSISFIGGDFNNVQGWVLNSHIDARYQFNKYFGAVLGISYFDADITIDKELKSTDVIYGYEGFFFGLHAIF